MKAAAIQMVFALVHCITNSSSKTGNYSGPGRLNIRTTVSKGIYNRTEILREIPAARKNFSLITSSAN